ncbi:hypothetical protein PTKIN_Ptkin16aG0029400 [Pterospermum kingtungense]
MSVQTRQVLVVIYFIILFSLFSRYNTFKEDPPSSYNNYIKEVVAAGYDPEAYLSYFSTIIEDGNFMDLIKLRSEILSLQRLGTSTSAKTVNVDDFGATADGTDDTEAFGKAWKEACSSEGAVVLEVPQEKSYLLKPIRFSGPCKSNLTIQIYGTIEASDDRSDYKEDSRHWLTFENVDNLLIEGGGNINGNGKIWWDNSCKINKHLPCKDAPTPFYFGVMQNCLSGSDLLQEKKLDSDDCISIVSGSKTVQAMDITCGPGHGISIGSLGSGNSKAYVSNVTVDGAKLSGTTNGVRIKTWQGGSGTASNIIFQNIEMNNVRNPIIIDQNYCDRHKPCKEQSSAVQVKNVAYKNIKGTSASEVAIKFNCSKNRPCQGIALQNVNLQEQGDRAAKAICNNVKLSEGEDVFPQCPRP